MGESVMIRCTYNNGGEGELVGFSGRCSEDVIKLNIKRWGLCKNADSRCRKYYDSGFRSRIEKHPCMESVLFRDWRYDAGHYFSSPRVERPKNVARDTQGGVAILTTVFPGEGEIDRRIIGFYKILEVNDHPDRPTELVGSQEMGVRLPLEEARQLFLWEYYTTKGGAKWNAGLIRYFKDEGVAAILRDLSATLQSEEHLRIVNGILQTDFRHVSRKPVKGCRPRKKGEDRRKQIILARKYGGGGEGPDHKNLKEWIAKHPEEIGLPRKSKADTEHIYLCQDSADILFTLPGGRFAAVEVKTYNPMPGCHQALKYRTLTCAEFGLPVKSPRVVAIVVAWEIPEDVAEFCKKYGIRYFEKRV